MISRYYDSTESKKNEEMIGMFTQIHSRKQDKINSRKPCFPYDTIDKIETPSLLLNSEQLQDNINAMNGMIDNDGVMLRPNVSIHRSSDIISLQLKMHNNGGKPRMNGIRLSSVDEAELLINSMTNFLNTSIDNKISDILLGNICIDLPKQWRFVSLYDSNMISMRLNIFIDDIFQIHLWNFSMDEFKKTNQNILNRHTSLASNDTMHQSNLLKLGCMICLCSEEGTGVGLNINNSEQMQILNDVITMINGDYKNNLYLRGFVVNEADKDVEKWINDNNYSDLVIGNKNEIYGDKYIYEGPSSGNSGDKNALTILSTISNVYEDGKGKFIHLLDVGYNGYGKIPLKVFKYHRPKYTLDNDPSLSAKVNKEELDKDYKYEIINKDDNNINNTMLICDKELDVGGKIELIPNDFYYSTINLYQYYSVINKDQVVDGIWTIDGRGQ